MQENYIGFRYEWKYMQPLMSTYIDLVVLDYEAESAVEVSHSNTSQHVTLVCLSALIL